MGLENAVALITGATGGTGNPSVIVTSNKPFSAWGEIFGDDMAPTAMTDRLIHHSETRSLNGNSSRLRGKDLDARIGAKTRRPRLTPPDPERVA